MSEVLYLWLFNYCII